ncbi:hypothetical protein VTK26DRAFT_2798 [Humicola hyalothermophila]
MDVCVATAAKSLLRQEKPTAENEGGGTHDGRMKLMANVVPILEAKEGGKGREAYLADLADRTDAPTPQAKSKPFILQPPLLRAIIADISSELFIDPKLIDLRLIDPELIDPGTIDPNYSATTEARPGQQPPAPPSVHAAYLACISPLYNLKGSRRNPAPTDPNTRYTSSSPPYAGPSEGYYHPVLLGYTPVSLTSPPVIAGYTPAGIILPDTMALTTATTTAPPGALQQQQQQQAVQPNPSLPPVSNVLQAPAANSPMTDEHNETKGTSPNSDTSAAQKDQFLCEEKGCTRKCITAAANTSAKRKVACGLLEATVSLGAQISNTIYGGEYIQNLGS